MQTQRLLLITAPDLFLIIRRRRQNPEVYELRTMLLRAAASVDIALAIGR